RNDDEDQPEVMKSTLLRRNIACGYGSRITSPIESFSENGLQEDSLWILKTYEGKKIDGQQQDIVYEIECQLAGGLLNVKSSLFIPHIDEVNGIMSQDKLGIDITLIGRHLVRCEVVKYKVCEKMKVTNDDGQEIEEKVKERELHCQTELMENSLQWENETQFTIQTRYQIVRKWKSMEIWLIFADESQISEILNSEGNQTQRQNIIARNFQTVMEIDMKQEGRDINFSPLEAKINQASFFDKETTGLRNLIY
ncbi:MAG: hypothetical protein EZS28_006665, partial [Streblomastix strix]